MVRVVRRAFIRWARTRSGDEIHVGRADGAPRCLRNAQMPETVSAVRAKGRDSRRGIRDPNHTRFYRFFLSSGLEGDAVSTPPFGTEKGPHVHFCIAGNDLQRRKRPARLATDRESVDTLTWNDLS